MSTTLRIALLAGLLAFASNLLIIGFIHWQTRDEIVSALRREVVEQSAALDRVYRTGGINAVQKEVTEASEAGDPQAAVAILDRNGAPLGGNVAAIEAPGPASFGKARSAVLRMQGESSMLEASVDFRPLQDGRWLLTGRTVSAGISLRETLERSLLVALAVSVILGLLCGLVIGEYVDRRVRHIVKVADRISAGDMSGRVPLTGAKDSFEGLSRQINQMLDRISTLMGELRMLTDSLAHDLRSPVGRLRAAADAALAAESPEERDQMLGAIIRQSDSLMRILTTALEIARSEAFTSQNQFGWFDPAQLAAELVEMYEPVAEEAGAALRLDRGPVIVPVFGHRQLLAQALSNLIENAIKYAASGREIAVLVHDEDSTLMLGVSDRGPGIPAGRREEARRRFGRLDPSRSEEGAGLGLSLVQAIAHLHKGDLALIDNAPGLIALLQIPVRSERSDSEVALLGLAV
ncbi:MAG: HAMP domain-containing protein [Sphingomonas sp.]|nr:HAMP domain-containing protein [Sphingomonas sp.]